MCMRFAKRLNKKENGMKGFIGCTVLVEDRGGPARRIPMEMRIEKLSPSGVYVFVSYGKNGSGDWYEVKSEKSFGLIGQSDGLSYYVLETLKQKK